MVKYMLQYIYYTLYVLFDRQTIGGWERDEVFAAAG